MGGTLEFYDSKTGEFKQSTAETVVNTSKFVENAMRVTRGKLHFHNGPFRTGSAFGRDKEHCLCKVLRPVILLSQFSGLVPVSHDKENCKMVHKWISYPSFGNLWWIIGNFIGIAMALPSIRRIFVSQLSGIDSYAFRIVIAVEFLSTIVIFFSAGPSASSFTKMWNELHYTTEEVAMPNFHRVKRLIYLLPLYLTQEIFVDMLIYSSIIWSGSVPVEELPIIVQVGSLTANVIPNIIAGIYSVFLSIISQNFKTINRNLQAALHIDETLGIVGVNWNPKLASTVGRYRILHERLCGTVRLLEQCFGAQMMAVFMGTCISFVAGVYALIIGSQGLAPPSINGLIVGFGLSTLISTLRLMIVIWFCQNVMNEANGTAHVLNNFNPETCGDEEVNTQVDKFLDKLGNFPLQTRCCNVFSLGNSFLASASSTVVTYVLILIQFRVDEK